MEQLKLILTLNNNGSITARWSAVSNLIRYKIYMYPLGQSYMIYNQQDWHSTTYTSEANLPANKQYKVVLEAVRSSGGNISDAKQVLIPSDFYDNQPIGTPKNIKAVADTISVTVSFDQVDHARSYDILFDNKVTNITTTSKKYTGLTPKTSHTYAVRAKTSKQTSAYSPTKTIWTLPKTPAVPSSIQKSVTETSATLSWNKAADATSYDILFNGSTYNVTSLTRTFTGLTAGKSYTYQIRSKNADAASAYTPANTVTTPPKAPTSITAASTETTATVTWNKVTGAAGYIVRFNNSDIHCKATDTSYTSTGLKPKTSYSYQVCCKSADGSGSFSTSRSIITKAQIPPAPTNITKSSTENSATVSWGGVSGATGYDVYFNGSTYGVTTTSKTFTGLAANTSYTYKVRSKSADGVSAYGADQTVKTTPNAPISNNVSGTTNENSVTVSWTAIAGAASYDVLFNGTVYNVAGTSKTITGLSANTGYSYQIRVRNGDGASSYSTAKTIRTTPNPPAAPTVNATNYSVTISWPSVTGATSYDLMFNGTAYRVTGTSKIISGLAPGTNYSYQIRSNNADGSSNYSAARTVATLPNPPATPTNISAVSTMNSVTVSWGVVSGATEYELFFNNATYSVSGTSKTITGLASDTSYDYKIRAKNAGGTSAYSTVRTIRTLVQPPVTPTGVSASATYNSVTVTWNAVTVATGYDVVFNGKVYSTASTVITFSNLAANTSYTIQVRAKNSAGTSAYSALKSIKTPVQPPAVPGNVRATATGDSLTVSWNAVSGATSYDVLFNGSVYSVTATSKTFSGLSAGTAYGYQVRAKNAGGASAYSASESIVTIPPVPADLGAVVTDTTMTVDWNGARGARSYDLKFNNSEVNVTGTSHGFANLSPNTDYSYQVRAKNDSGASTYSSLVTTRTLLSVPTGVNASATIDTVTISWNMVSGAAGYDVKFNGNIYNVTGTSKEITGLIPETEYTYAVQAKNASNYSEYSPQMKVSTLRAVPDTPDNVSAEATMNRVVVSWDEVQNVTEYEVEFDGNASVIAGETQTRTVLKKQARSANRFYCAYSGLKPNTLHSCRVRAKNNYGTGDYSPKKSVTTKKYKRNGLPAMRGHKSYPDGRIPHTGMDPVNALTGSFLWSYTFLENFGKDALQFTLMYDSQRDEQAIVLGKGWTHSFNYLLYKDEQYYYFTTPYDEVTAFVIEEGTSIFLPDEESGSDYRLEKKTDGSCSIKDLDGTEYVFDSALHLSKIWENGLVSCQFETNQSGQPIRITGRHGEAFSLTYTGEHLTKVTDALEHAVSFAYGGEYLTAAVNPKGNTMSFVYDENGRITEIKDFSGGIYLTNQYDVFDRVISQTMAGRSASTAVYSDGLTIFTDEAGNATKYYYNAAGCITRIELEGTSVLSSYNERGQVTERTDAIGNKTIMGYDAAGRMNCVTYPDGTTEKITYNDRNLPIHMVNRDNTETHYTYDAGNNLLSAQDERENTSSYTYDDNNNLTGYTDKEGHKWTYLYDNNQHVREAADPEGNRYLYTHDAIGRLTAYTTPAGRITTYEYSAVGDLQKIVDADGNQVFTYDSNGNCTGVTDRMGHDQRLEYNSMGQVVLATDFLGKEYHFSYDERGNLLSETDPLGYCTRYAYDAFGNKISHTDKNNGITRFYFDAANRLVQIKDAANGTVSYTYDAMGQVTAVTDPLTHQTTYAYDQAGRVQSKTDALGHSVSYTYDRTGNMLTRTDEDGVVTTYGYDRENRLISILTAAGTTSFTYDKLGRVVTVLDTDGHTENARYDGDGNLTASLDKESRQTSFTYDSMGRLSQETAPNGGKTTYTYDKNGNCVQRTDAENHVYAYAYDANNRLVKSIDPLAKETAYGYDDRGQLVSVTDANGGITQYVYDGNGNLIRETNAVGGEKTYTYDSMNRLTGIKDEVGHSFAYAYDASGNRISYTDANGNSWSYAYDANNRLISVTGDDEGSLTLAYTNTGNILSVTDMEEAVTRYQYDTLGRLTQMSDALGHSLTFTYDSVGNILEQTDANGHTTEYSYSPAGNLISVKDAEGGITSYTYDALGQILTQKDPLNNEVSYTYNLLGQVTSMTNALGSTTNFTYTPNGQIAAVQHASGDITRYTYDACGNLIQTEDALGNVVVYEYDAMNNQIKECMSISGEQTCATLYQYDKKGRVMKEINPILDEKVYTYDGNDNMVSFRDESQRETTVRYDLNNQPVSMAYSDGKTAVFRYNKRGELVQMQDWNGTTAMERDVLGRLAKVTDSNGRVTGFTYDAAGNRIGITYPDGSTAAYSYDKTDRLLKVTDAEGKTSQFAYDTAGNLLSLTQPGSAVSYTYNANRQPVKAAYRLGETVSMEETFAYDVLGRMTGSERTGTTAELTRSAAYAYDAAGQLVTYRNGQEVESYTYDRLGNRTAKSINGVQKAACQYNALNQLTAMTEEGIEYHYGYDKQGNLTEERRGDSPIRQYVYDATGRMVLGKNLESGEETAYAYNALQMRIKNVQRLGAAGSQRTKEIQYVPDFLSATGNELMSYETGAGAARSIFGRDYERLSRKTETGTTHFLPDMYGSPLFAADGQGDMVQYAERNVWGDLKPGMETAAGQEENMRFTSYIMDPVIGKYFARARFYDSGTGRMLSKDPVNRGLNRYRYCDNDPVNYEDSTGEILNILAGGVIGGAVGGAFGFGGSVLNQVMSGEKINWRKAAGAAANGAVVGSVRGAMVTSGAGIPLIFAADLAAGTLGSILEQKISTGKVSARRSITSGLTNAVGGAIYGKQPFKGAGDAFGRGALSGAATSGINYISELSGDYGGNRRGQLSLYAMQGDPRRDCGSPSPFAGRLGYSTASGYQYGTGHGGGNSHGNRKEFSLTDFGKSVLSGGLTGGLASLSFYGAGKAFEGLRNSVRVNEGGSTSKVDDIVDMMRQGKKTPDGRRIIYQQDEKTIIIFGLDLNENAHPLRNQGYKDPVNHMNIEIQTRSDSGRTYTKWDMHMILDKIGKVTDTVITGPWKDR